MAVSRFVKLFVFCSFCWAGSVWALETYPAVTTFEVIGEHVDDAALQGEQLRGASSVDELLKKTFNLAERKNVRQKILRDVWRPVFVTDDDVDRFIILLNQRVLERRWLRDRYFSWKVDSLELDEAYGYAKAEIVLWGISRFWLPRRNTITIEMNKIGDRWLMKGPELVDIDGGKDIRYRQFRY